MTDDMLATRVGALDWTRLERELWSRGWAETPEVLDVETCRTLAATFDDETRFRTRVDMARHRFGDPLVLTLRRVFLPGIRADS